MSIACPCIHTAPSGKVLGNADAEDVAKHSFMVRFFSLLRLRAKQVAFVIVTAWVWLLSRYRDRAESINFPSRAQLDLQVAHKQLSSLLASVRVALQASSSDVLLAWPSSSFWLASLPTENTKLTRLVLDW